MCPKNRHRKHDALRTDPCSECPRVIKRAAFKGEVERAWARWLSETQRIGLKFDDMLTEVYRASSLRGSPADQLPYQVSFMVNVFEDENDRWDKEQRSN